MSVIFYVSYKLRLSKYKRADKKISKWVSQTSKLFQSHSRNRKGLEIQGKFLPVNGRTISVTLITFTYIFTDCQIRLKGFN